MSRSGPCDRGLEVRAQRGDREAWNALIERHNHRVVVFLVSRGLRPCEARELAQEVWIRLMQQQRDERLSRIELPGLALAQARFLHLDRMRQERVLVPLDAVRGLPDPAAAERPLDRVRLGRALAALDRCSERDRALFEAAYAEQAPSQRVLANTFGLSLQRTKQILCSVRATLRRALED